MGASRSCAHRRASTPATSRYVEQIHAGEDAATLPTDEVKEAFRGTYDGFTKMHAPSAKQQPAEVLPNSSLPPSLRGEWDDELKAYQEFQAASEGGRPAERDVSSYGSWYIPVKRWKVRPKGQPLIGPAAEKMLEAKREAEQQKQSHLTSQISSSAGAKLFREYLETSGQPVPQFLSSVGP